MRESMPLFVPVQLLIRDLQASEGLISYTFDAWTSRAGDPYLGVTAHQVRNTPDDPTKWKLESDLLAYTEIFGDHSGRNSARILRYVFDRYGIRDKVSSTSRCYCSAVLTPLVAWLGNI